ncbi:MAG: NADH-quinone oxidoreductase subunit L, partial [Aeromicrobium sp.]
AALSALGGVLAIGDWIGDFLAPVVGAAPHEELPMPAIAITLMILVVVVIGVVAAWALYLREPIAGETPPDSSVSVFTRAGRRDLYGDDFNDAVIVRPVRHLTRALVYLDTAAVDGAVSGFADRVGEGSDQLRKIQNGFVRSYALSIFVGALLVVLALLAVNLA